MSQNRVYLIGEIGQNHNGDVSIAKRLCDILAQPSIEEYFGIKIRPYDAVKMTKRDLSHEMSNSQYNSKYQTAHSYGTTYGEHREALELSEEEHFEIFQYAKKLGLEFIETLCSPTCLSILKLFYPDKLKIASRDITNIPLIDAIAETHIPIILSIGMSGKRELDEAINHIQRHHSNITILQCLSQYPASPSALHLNKIRYLINNYPNCNIGFSDHTIGVAASILAIGLGARVIEKHITLDRNMKGSDHIGSLSPDGIKRLVRDVRLSELWLGNEFLGIPPEAMSAQKKLSRSLATKYYIPKDHIITENDLQLLSPGDGYQWFERGLIIGKKTNCAIPTNEIIYPNMLL